MSFSLWGTGMQGTQEIHGVTGKFGLGVQNEAGKRLRVLPREYTGDSKHPLPTAQEKTLYMDITRWPTLKSDWLYSLQSNMEKLYTVSKNKTGSRLGLRSWTAATAAAKSLQSCPTLCDPIDGSPPGSPVPGILQARTLEWVAISFSNFTVYVYVNLHGKPIDLVPSSKDKYTQISSEEISPKCFFLNKLEWYIMFI